MMVITMMVMMKTLLQDEDIDHGDDIMNMMINFSGRGATAEVEPNHSPRDLQRDDLGGGTMLLLDISPFNCFLRILLF